MKSLSVLLTEIETFFKLNNSCRYVSWNKLAIKDTCDRRQDEIFFTTEKDIPPIIPLHFLQRKSPLNPASHGMLNKENFQWPLCQLVSSIDIL